VKKKAAAVAAAAAAAAAAKQRQPAQAIQQLAQKSLLSRTHSV